VAACNWTEQARAAHAQTAACELQTGRERDCFLLFAADVSRSDWSRRFYHFNLLNQVFSVKNNLKKIPKFIIFFPL
jgi:hypothetical protein